MFLEVSFQKLDNISYPKILPMALSIANTVCQADSIDVVSKIISKNNTVVFFVEDEIIGFTSYSTSGKNIRCSLLYIAPSFQKTKATRDIFRYYISIAKKANKNIEYTYSLDNAEMRLFSLRRAKKIASFFGYNTRYEKRVMPIVRRV